MRLVNRLLQFLGLLFVAAAVTVLLVAPEVVADFATRLNNATSLGRAIQVVIALLIDVVLLALAWRTIRPPKVEGLTVRSRGAKTAVSIDSVQRQINNTIAQVNDVLAVQTEVIEENGDVRVNLRVRARPDIIVPEKQKEISRVLRQVVEKQLGLRLAGQAVIHIALSADEYESMDERAMLITDDEPYITSHPVPRYSLSAQSTVPEDDDEPYTPPAAPERPAPRYTEPEPEQPPVQAAPPPTPEPEPEPEEPWRAFLLEDDEATPPPRNNQGE